MIVLDKLTQAERDALYEIRTFNRFRKTFAVHVATEYFRTLEAYDATRNTRTYYDTRVALQSQSRDWRRPAWSPRSRSIRFSRTCSGPATTWS